GDADGFYCTMSRNSCVANLEAERECEMPLKRRRMRDVLSSLRSDESSVRGILVLLLVDVFIIAPVAQEQALPAVQPIIHSIVLLMGVAIALRSRTPTLTMVGVLAFTSFF